MTRLPSQRIILAFLIAPWVAPHLLALASWAATREPDVRLIRDVLPFYYAFGLPIAYIAEVIIGIPLFLLLRHNHWTSLSVFAAAGALLALAVHAFAVMISMLSMPSRGAIHTTAPIILLYLLAGGLTGILFRAILFFRLR